MSTAADGAWPAWVSWASSAGLGWRPGRGAGMSTDDDLLTDHGLDRPLQGGRLSRSSRRMTNDRGIHCQASRGCQALRSQPQRRRNYVDLHTRSSGDKRDIFPSAAGRSRVTGSPGVRKATVRAGRMLDPAVLTCSPIEDVRGGPADARGEPARAGGAGRSDGSRRRGHGRVGDSRARIRSAAWLRGRRADSAGGAVAEGDTRAARRPGRGQCGVDPHRSGGPVGRAAGGLARGESGRRD